MNNNFYSASKSSESRRFFEDITKTAKSAAADKQKGDQRETGKKKKKAGKENAAPALLPPPKKRAVVVAAIPSFVPTAELPPAKKVTEFRFDHKKAADFTEQACMDEFRDADPARATMSADKVATLAWRKKGLKRRGKKATGTPAVFGSLAVVSRAQASAVNFQYLGGALPPALADEKKALGWKLSDDVFVCALSETAAACEGVVTGILCGFLKACEEAGVKPTASKFAEFAAGLKSDADFTAKHVKQLHVFLSALHAMLEEAVGMNTPLEIEATERKKRTVDASFFGDL